MKKRIWYIALPFAAFIFLSCTANAENKFVLTEITGITISWKKHEYKTSEQMKGFVDANEAFFAEILDSYGEIKVISSLFDVDGRKSIDTEEQVSYIFELTNFKIPSVWIVTIFPNKKAAFISGHRLYLDGSASFAYHATVKETP